MKNMAEQVGICGGQLLAESKNRGFARNGAEGRLSCGIMAF